MDGFISIDRRSSGGVLVARPTEPIQVIVESRDRAMSGFAVQLRFVVADLIRGLQPTD